MKIKMKWRVVDSNQGFKIVWDEFPPDLIGKYCYEVDGVIIKSVGFPEIETYSNGMIRKIYLPGTRIRQLASGQLDIVRQTEYYNNIYRDSVIKILNQITQRMVITRGDL